MQQTNTSFNEFALIADHTIREAALLLGEAAKPARVILFGSYAHGDAGESSDLDFMVVEPTLPDKFHEMVRLRQVLRPLRIPADVLICSQADIVQQQASCSTAICWALREGKMLMTPPLDVAQRAGMALGFAIW